MTMTEAERIAGINRRIEALETQHLIRGEYRFEVSFDENDNEEYDGLPAIARLVFVPDSDPMNTIDAREFAGGLTVEAARDALRERMDEANRSIRATGRRFEINCERASLERLRDTLRVSSEALAA